MYIKLGNTEINQITEPIGEDKTIFASIIDSGVSYEKPVTVRMVQELVMWFGTEFEEFSYFSELLEKGFRLVLHRPLLEKEEDDSGEKEEYVRELGRINMYPSDSDFPNPDKLVYPGEDGNYIFREGSWEKVDEIPEGWIEMTNFPEEMKKTGEIDHTKRPGLQDFIFEAIETDGSIVNVVWDTKEQKYYYIDLDGDDYEIEYSGSPSYFNRDTVAICSRGSDISHYHPVLEEHAEDLKLIPTESIISEVDNGRLVLVKDVNGERVFTFTDRIDIERINEGLDLLVYSLDFSGLNTTKVKEMWEAKEPVFQLIQFPKNGKLRNLVMYLVPNHESEEPEPGDEKEEPKTNLGKIRKVLKKSTSLDSCDFLECVVNLKDTDLQGKLRTLVKDKITDKEHGTKYDVHISESDGVLYFSPSKNMVRMRSLEFSNIPGVVVESEPYLSSLYLEEFLKERTRAVFTSKTIGAAAENHIPIEVEISELEDLGKNVRVQVRVSKGDYEEIFEGPIFGPSRVDTVITEKSRLVRAQFNDWYYYGGNKYLWSRAHSEGKDHDVDPKLPYGTWKLTGAYYEDIQGVDDYKRSLQVIKDGGFEQWPIDFLLVPYISDYCEDLDDYKYLNEFAEELNCQVLMQNNDYDKEVEVVNAKWSKSGDVDYKLPDVLDKDKVYVIPDKNGGLLLGIDGETGENIVNLEDLERYTIGNDFIDNVVDDYNRLVYFYRGMKVEGEDRPGYYLFLSDLFEKDQYLSSTDDILYNSPVDPSKSDPYDEDNTLTKLLEKKRSNYLVDNNFKYYYKTLFSGKKHETSIWLRFVSDKIRRELEKGKWNIIARSTKSNIKEEMSKILRSVKDDFAIIRSLEINSFELNDIDESLFVSIDTTISDIVDINITIDVILNYSN